MSWTDPRPPQKSQNPPPRAGSAEAPVGFEPTVADLQSAGLATCLRRPVVAYVKFSADSGQVRPQGWEGGVCIERLSCVEFIGFASFSASFSLPGGIG